MRRTRGTTPPGEVPSGDSEGLQPPHAGGAGMPAAPAKSLISRRISCSDVRSPATSRDRSIRSLAIAGSPSKRLSQAPDGPETCPTYGTDTAGAVSER
jgi:hypothetical protein